MVWGACDLLGRVTESKFALLAAQQANEVETRGRCKEDDFNPESWQTEKMAD